MDRYVVDTIGVSGELSQGEGEVARTRKTPPRRWFFAWEKAI